MADVRSLLRNERNARRISHQHAKYTEAGRLYCVVCRLELKSESLWDGHLRSKGHSTLLKRNGNDSGSPAGSTEPEPAQTKNSDEENATSGTPIENEPAAKRTKKRKASDDDEEEEQVDTSRKRTKQAPLPGFLPQGFFDDAAKADAEATASNNSNGQEFRLPSRPATPLKAPDALQEAPKLPTVDEDEWAAFEADIAAAEVVAAEPTDDAVISAAPMTTEEVAAKSREEEMSARKEKAEADLEGDKEDAVRKLEDEFEQMNELEERVRRLKEKREALRVKEPVAAPEPAEEEKTTASNATPEDEDGDDDDDDDDDEDDDDWAGFRLRG
ncbi:hypothetical protein V495_02104 [Pseudogymnoascus sp. VKM F-4514 (FW-929)]|nr:hypothetical protein V495_02104 [Pseudogymnoascus sp. VKM F-4514 (FW-929)]KFY58804.1 hypothetical protein V497_04653 [Pseudogymnoascus sp. VKM F-4516 (FW-969)]